MSALAESPKFTISGEKFGVIVARDLGGNQVATAFQGRDGWAVTNFRDHHVHQICVADYGAAVHMLEVVATEITGATVAVAVVTA